MKVLIFDFDGTLFDTREDIADAVNHARKFFSLSSLSLQTVTAMVGDGVTVLAERAFADTAVDPLDAKNRILEFYATKPAEKAVPYPGVLENLACVQGIRTIVSNKPKHLIKAILDEFSIADLFDFVAGGETFKKKKPDPMAVHHLLQRYEVLREAVFVIGDHSPDIEMAKRAGVTSIYCNYGFFGQDTVGADFTIDGFDQLPKLLEHLGNR